ncbi:MAG: rod shape-determining protein RodA [Epsilonproteobacteria bacterium]|nr:rod shape-determining protein RodA [Campylobacterota bacterium]
MNFSDERTAFSENNKIFIVASVVMLAVMSVYTLKSLHGTLWIKQLAWFVLGAFSIVIAVKMTHNFFYHYAYLFYLLGLALLFLVSVFGTKHFGAIRWIHIGIINLQPSEITKPLIILAVSRYLSDHQENRPLRLIHFLFATAIVVLPAFLVIMEPDLGTAIIMLSILLLVIFVAGIDKRIFFAIIILTFSAIPIIWKFLKGYQKARIIEFINPGSDPLGSSFQSVHSQIIIGSGQLFGHPLGSVFPWSNFLPQSSSDFFFALFAYQYGFAGILVLIAIFWLLISRFIKRAQNAEDNFSRYFIIGFTIIFSISLFFNIGMTLGLVPVVGVTLPLASYGGSSIIANMISIGIILSK